MHATITEQSEAAPLRLVNLTYGYEAGEPVVCDVSGDLAAGRLCCVIGPNAAGKSTLLKLMLGQLRPWSGEVWLLEKSVRHLAAGARAQLMSYVPQRGQVRFAFTVRQVVAMGRFAAGPDDAAVDRALAWCDLERLADRIFAHLSGGQQQRVLIARALAQAAGQGRVILLDEPGSSLDLWHLHQLMQLLRRLAGEGLAVLVVLHDLNLALRYADDVWLMDQGRLRAAGPWEQVLRPELLEPVYNVGLRRLHPEGAERPVFQIEPAATLV